MIPAKSWASSLIWGQDYSTADRRRTNTVTAETVIPFARRNDITGRYEWGPRDELFTADPSLGEEVFQATGKSVFDVNAMTAGYTRDVPLFREVQSGIGANFTACVIDKSLQRFYGSHTWGVKSKNEMPSPIKIGTIEYRSSSAKPRLRHALHTDPPPTNQILRTLDLSRSFARRARSPE